MKTLYVVEFITCQAGRDYSVVSNFYFETETAARTYALDFVKDSSIFSKFEIHQIIPYKL